MTLAATDWIAVDQAMITDFGRVTRDPDPMHVDPDWCAQHSPYGRPIAFGFLTLSLLTYFAHQLNSWPAGTFALNYGFDRVRFLAPVPVGAEIRALGEQISDSARTGGGRLVTSRFTVEIRGEPKPALVADWIGLLLPLPASSEGEAQ